MWHHLYVGGMGGVVLSADADGVDWGLRTLLLHPPNQRPEYILRFTNAGARTVNLNLLLDALERGGRTTLRKVANPGLPQSWTPLQRVISFLLVKALAGNDYHEAAVVTPDTALVTLFEFAATLPPLCDHEGVIDINAVVAMSLRFFFEHSGLGKHGESFPVIDLAAANGRQQLVHAHEFLRQEIADHYRPKANRPIAFGQVPSLRALELSAGRASTYVQYVASIATPREPFTGWTAPDSGFYLLGDTLLFHWDDNDKTSEPVLGPTSLVPAARAVGAKRPKPLSAVSTPRSASNTDSGTARACFLASPQQTLH